MIVSLQGGLPGFEYVIWDVVGGFYSSEFAGGAVSPNAAGITQLEIPDPRAWGVTQIAAVQRNQNQASGFSPTLTLRGPTSLAKPEIAPQPVWECGQATAVRGHQPGDAVKLFSGALLRFTIPSAFGTYDYMPAGSPGRFTANETVFTQYQTCEAARGGGNQVSPLSDPAFVKSFPGTLPVPRIVSNSVLPGTTQFQLEGIAQGAAVTLQLTRSGSPKSWSTVCAHDPCPVQIPTSVGAFMAGDDLQASQQLCRGSGSGNAALTVADCADVPPPQLASPPALGAVSISLSAYAPDSEIRVYSSKQSSPAAPYAALGRATAASTINLFRPIEAADKWIIVSQVSASCGVFSGNAYLVAD